MQAYNNQLDELQKLASSEDFFLKGEFKLTSGKKSNYYFDGRKLSMESRGLRLLVDIFSALIKRHEEKSGIEVVSIGGPAVGSIPIVGALSYHMKKDAFFVRSAEKTHGVGNVVEGVIKPKSPKLPKSGVVVVEDTITTGNSVLNAIKRVQELGHKVALVLAVMDRGNTFSATATNEGISYQNLLEISTQGGPKVVKAEIK